ncbi:MULTISPECIES: MauE/DoxX family redox-associated membrane protein [Corynebacterium]|uniref:DoxX protein n=1 Tax=Corynebacterium singulare TaxID=161899 RepID=A0A0B6EY17_9CORY|nr:MULTISPECIES: MauE/DoxX family redox-associated membrane protein [Corynebacterium]AJI79698.1 DoxX protein [Corynebacterium singulare]MCQ9676879.1 DoxX family membrane protein [Corynebacterium sp. BF-R-2]
MASLQLARVADIISALARFGMAAVWIIAGVQKLNAQMDMAQAIQAYEIFTPEWSGYLAVAIGPLEVMGGVLLLLGLFLREASAVGAVVLVLFMVGMAQAWARGLVIDCGCFGYTANSGSQGMNYMLTLLRDIVFLALTMWTIRRPYRRFAIYS